MPFNLYTILTCISQVYQSTQGLAAVLIPHKKQYGSPDTHTHTHTHTHPEYSSQESEAIARIKDITIIPQQENNKVIKQKIFF